MAQGQDSPVYLNLGVDSFEASSYSVSGKLGYNFTKYFGVEGEAAVGVVDDEVNGFDVGIDKSFGAFGRFRLPTFDKGGLFARAGYTRKDWRLSSELLSFDVQSQGFAGGVGGEYMLTKKTGVRMEYTFHDLNFDIADDHAFLDDDQINGDFVTFSFLQKF